MPNLILFTPLTIGGTTLKNRIGVVPSTDGPGLSMQRIDAA